MSNRGTQSVPFRLVLADILVRFSAIAYLISMVAIPVAAVHYFATRGDDKIEAEENFSADIALDSDYTDVKGRFKCRYPSGWNIERKDPDERSYVVIEKYPFEIRIIARETSRHVLDESDREELQNLIDRLMVQAKREGGETTRSDVSLRKLGNIDALETVVEIKGPSYLYLKQIKYKSNGCDHTIGVGTSNSRSQNLLNELYDSFINSYVSLPL